MFNINLTRVVVRVSIKDIVNEFRKRLNAELGCHIEKVILFGSASRSDYTAESDIDVALVLNENARDKAQVFEDTIVQIIVELNIKYGVAIIPLIYISSEYQKRLQLGMPLIEIIEKEGIPV
jgi:predicted nucleotidyltransferase